MSMIAALLLMSLTLAGPASAVAAAPDRKGRLSDERLSGLQRDLTAALGNAFEFVAGELTADKTDTPYWLATVRAQRAGSFVLRYTVRYRFPAGQEILPPAYDGATFAFRLIIGQAGEPRDYQPGGPTMRTYSQPYACVGDSLVLPIRLLPSDTEHHFTMPAERSPMDDADLKSQREVAGSDWIIRRTTAAFAIHNLASNFVRVAASNSRSSINITGSATSCGFEALLEAAAPGRFTLRSRLPGSATSGGGVACEVSPRDTPLTIPVDWWEIDQYSSRDNFHGLSNGEASPAIHRLRAGDRIILSCGDIILKRGETLPAHPLFEICADAVTPPPHCLGRTAE